MKKANGNGAVKIEKGIPIPLLRRHCSYPLEAMKVGDSISVPGEQIQLLRMAISQWCKRHDDGRRYVTRKQEVGYRCWRVE